VVKPEPVDLPLDLAAVAIDTNSTGADLQLSRVKRLADLLDEQELDEIRIWVPEPVVWEWAEHAHKKFESIRIAADQLGKTGLPEFQALSGIAERSVGELVKSIEAALARIPHLEILRLDESPLAAIDGLRDQVLQTGVGRRKGAEGTKTGAADSTSFRLIEIAADGDVEERVVVVSADKDALLYFTGEGGTILLRDWNLLRVSVLAMVPSEKEVASGAAAAIRAHLRKFVAETGEHLRYGTLEGDVDRAHSRYANYEAERTLGVSHLDRIGSPEILLVSRKAGYASAQVDVTLTLFSESAWYDVGNESVEQDDEVFSDVPAVVTVWADNEGGEWEIDVQTVFVPDEGSEEAHRIMAVVDSDEPEA